MSKPDDLVHRTLDLRLAKILAMQPCTAGQSLRLRSVSGDVLQLRTIAVGCRGFVPAGAQPGNAPTGPCG